jgi:hypothetical protein
LGGRVDVIGHAPVATIVYKHADVAVSDLPAADLATFERAFSAGSPAPEVK